MKVAVPDLRAARLSFKRIQRLSFNERPVVQMVYLPERGEPVALCVTPDARPDEAPHLQQIGELSTVAWRRDGLGYALLSKGSGQSLMDLGRHIVNGQTNKLYGRSRSSPVRNTA